LSLYRILSKEKRLYPFRPSQLATNYQERDLEDWIEQSPEVLVGDEPLLIIGRQVITPVGIVDLLALDSNAAGVIIELKRAPRQREAVGQSLEYAGWLSSLGGVEVQEIAERFLRKTNSVSSLEEAWQATFSADLKESALNARQRVFIVIEGQDDRMTALVRYLRLSGLDISLLTYNFYRTEGGEEILLVEVQVGESEPASHEDTEPSETRLCAVWPQQVVEAYQALKEVFVSKGLYAKPKKTGMSFYVQTTEGSAFICYFNSAGDYASIWIRADSMKASMDFEAVASQIRDGMPPGCQINHTPTWFIVRFRACVEDAQKIAELVLGGIVGRLSGTIPVDE